ncbi:MAG TPA: N-acetyltransferase [Anaerolineales bacterium]
MDFDTKTASDYPIPDLVEILNRGFEGYFVLIAFDVTAFLNMLRKDGIDLSISRVLFADGGPTGIALLARRGTLRASRLAAMGIVPEFRGRGAGSWFMERLINEACERGEHEMVLEVIKQNEPAVHLYEKCGFQIVRKLISFSRKDAIEDEPHELHEMDLREAGRLISQYGLSDLPWQLSGETIAQLNPPARAYSNGQVCLVISNPEAKDVVIWSLLVEPVASENELALGLLKSVIAAYPGRTWHVPALLPEELGNVYERAGFIREELSQWQMKLSL